MKRAYYTDPLAAAWMAKHHGMLFYDPQSPLGRPFSVCGSGYEANMVFRADYRHDPQYFYIHPDSMALLEPMAGDLMHGLEDDGYFILLSPGHNPRPIIEWDDPCIIIQRNGRAFHWPEWEE